MKSLIKSTIFTAITAFIAFGQLSYAQDDDDDDNTDITTSSKRYWEADLPGGNYMVAIDRISSVSIHTYVIGQSYIVKEVNIQTSGSGLVRFYTFEVPGESGAANTAKNLIERGKTIIETGGARTGVDLNTTVEKEYPITTHAHTIEFRLFDTADLEELYASVKRALKERRGRKFTIK